MVRNVLQFFAIGSFGKTTSVQRANARVTRGARKRKEEAGGYRKKWREGERSSPILLLPPFYAELYNNGMEGWKETFDRLNWIGGTSATKERR